MEKYMLSSRQLIVLIVLFLFGSSVVIGVNIGSGVAQSSWISLILSLILTIPYILILARIVTLFPHKNIYEIFEELFGRKISKVLTILFMLYALYLGAIVLCNFNQYVNVTTLPDTPIMPISLCFILIITYLTKSGIKTIGRWGPIILTLLIIVIMLTIFLSIPLFEVKNMLPIFEDSLGNIFKSSFNIFVLPFSELIVILGLADHFDVVKKEKKTFLLGIIIDVFLILTISVRNILILGAPMIKDSLFSAYETVRIIEFGDFLMRVEGVVTINFILGGITKIALFVIAISKGFCYLTKNNDFRNYIFLVGLIVFAIAPFLFEDVVDMFDFAPIFGLYSLPFQVILPVFIWILIEFRKKKIYNKKS